MKGECEIAKAIKQLFKLDCEKYGLKEEEIGVATHHFGKEPQEQMEMFTT